MIRWLPIALAGCNWFVPTLGDLDESPLLVPIESPTEVSTGARLPTDLHALDSGGFLVLDGYTNQARAFSAAGEPTEHASIEQWGRPVRSSPSSDQDRWWLADPRASEVVALKDSKIVERVGIAPDLVEVPASPIDVLEIDGTLIVGLREGPILGIRDGELAWKTTEDVDGRPFRAIADLTALDDGFLAVDALGSKVHKLNLDGEPVTWFGRYGMWAGYLHKPKSAVVGPSDTILVADSALGAVQLFDMDGTPLGALSVDGDAWDAGHPIALAATEDPNSFRALDARSGNVYEFELPEQTIADAKVAGQVRHLRYPLIPISSGDNWQDPANCYQCHDGMVNDDRFVFDPLLAHHPVNVIPKMEIPPIYRLDEEGKIRCSTCHSPHGNSTLREVEASAQTHDASALVRHRSTNFLRVQNDDAELCIGCHGDAAHDNFLEAMNIEGRAHPSGSELAKLMEGRGTDGLLGMPEDVSGSCLTCHAVHGAATDSLMRSADSGEVCVACHSEKRTAKNHPMAVDEPGAGLHVDAPRHPPTCLSCHNQVGGVGDALLRFEDGEPPCAECHSDQELSGKHAELPGHQDISCLSCHAVHGEERPLLATRNNASRGDPNGCLSCHGKGSETWRAGVHPKAEGHPVGRKDLTCQTCHDPHEPNKEPKACISCHEEHVGAIATAGHGQVDCAECHPPHAKPPMAKLDRNPSANRCLACHAVSAPTTAPKVENDQHPAPVFHPDGSRWAPLGDLPLFDAKGNQVPSDQNGDLVCMSCHRPHDPDPKTKGDHLRRDGWEATCSACHGRDGLILYRYFHQPNRWPPRGGNE